MYIIFKATKIDHILDHKTILTRYKMIQFISSIFFNHNRIKLELIIERSLEKSPKY